MTQELEVVAQEDKLKFIIKLPKLIITIEDDPVIKTIIGMNTEDTIFLQSSAELYKAIKECIKDNTSKDLPTYLVSSVFHGMKERGTLLRFKVSETRDAVIDKITGELSILDVVTEISTSKDMINSFYFKLPFYQTSTGELRIDPVPYYTREEYEKHIQEDNHMTRLLKTNQNIRFLLFTWEQASNKFMSEQPVEFFKDWSLQEVIDIYKDIAPEGFEEYHKHIARYSTNQDAVKVAINYHGQLIKDKISVNK